MYLLYPMPILSLYDEEENQTSHIRGEPGPFMVLMKDAPHTNVDLLGPKRSHILTIDTRGGKRQVRKMGRGDRKNKRKR